MGTVISIDEWKARHHGITMGAEGRGLAPVDDLARLRRVVANIERLARDRFGVGAVGLDVERAVNEVIDHLAHANVGAALARAERLADLLEADVG